MWDMMLYGGGPYSRHYRRSRHNKKGRKCRACRERIGKVTIGGKKVDMVYCEKHHCQKIMTDGTVCQEQRNGRNPLWRYCDLHLRCRAPGSDDMPCMKYVKDADPEKFRYCNDHGCRYPHCEHSKHEGSKGYYCPQHSCLAKPHSNSNSRNNSCDQPRLVQEGSLFCEKHTCEGRTCTAEADGKGERGDPGRSCDQHRRCAREGCAAPCFRRDTGATVRWCGMHYCHQDPCDEPRAGGLLSLSGSGGGGGGGGSTSLYCDRHTCLEPMCGGGRKAVGGRFCTDHQCKAEGCLERRDQRFKGSEHCALHVCWVEGCPRPAVATGNRCDIHRECREMGCREYIYVEKGPGEDVKYPTCEKHYKPQCPALTLGGTQCDKRLDKGQRYCRDHSCELGSCGDQRRADSLQYCASHRCSVPGCQQLRRGAAAVVAGLDLDLLAGLPSLRASLLLGGGDAAAGMAAAAGGGGGAGGGLTASSYCATHACRGEGSRCGDRVAEVGTSSFCSRHECSRRGCVKEASGWPRRKGDKVGGLCDRHYKKRKGGSGRGPPLGPFGPMEMPMGFPPVFGGQVYDSSDSDSDSDDGRSPRGLPFGGVFPRV